MRDNPMGLLLAARSRRPGRRGQSPTAGPLKALTTVISLLILLPLLGVVAFTTVTVYLEGGPVALGWVALGLVGMVSLVVLPGLAARTAGDTLGWLVQGRCIEEMLNSRLRPALIVDGIALCAGGSALRLAFPLWIGLLLGAGFLASEGGETLALLLAALWFPAVLAVTLPAAYAGQVCGWSSLSRDTFRGVLFSALLCAGILPGVWGLTLLAPSPAWGGAVLLASLVWMVLMARAVTVASLSGLSWLARLEHWWGSLGIRTGRRPARVEHPNPLVVREWMRDHSRTWLARNWGSLAVLGLGSLYSLPFATLEGPPPWVAPLAAMVIVANLAPLRAACRSLDVTLRAGEAQTLETLFLSRLTLAEVVEGAAWLGWWPRFRETLCLGIALVPVGLALAGGALPGAVNLWSASTAVGSLCVGLAYFSICLRAAAYLGVAAAGGATSRREAWGRLIGLGMGSVFLWQLGHVLFMLLGGALGVPNAGMFLLVLPMAWTSLYPLGVLWLSRRYAYLGLAHRADRAGFGAR